jgi:ATP-dependent RNA helicase RhlE
VSKPAEGITHAMYPVQSTRKQDLMVELLHREESSNVLVFTRTKHRANRLAAFLEGKGVACERIHGNRSQSQRNAALDGFKRGRFRVLVATDIAARGIDVVALGHVVNFDVPAASEDYIHRVGRTGRAELTGEAFTFVAPEDEGDLRAIERAIHKTLPRVLLPDFDYAQAPPASPPARPDALRRDEGGRQGHGRRPGQGRREAEGQRHGAGPRRAPGQRPAHAPGGAGQGRGADGAWGERLERDVRGAGGSASRRPPSGRRSFGGRRPR